MSYSTGTVAKNGTDKRLGIFPAMEKCRAADRKPVIGSWLMLPGAHVARMTAASGFDFVLVDGEHGNLGDAEVHDSVAAVAGQGCSPIVRVAAPENYLIKRALDTGAHGILCPMTATAEEARKIVQYAKFPVPTALRKQKPELISGIRGVGSPFAPAVFGQTLPDYISTANQNTMVAVQIESVGGLQNCEEIAKVDGIDMVFVGPNDLCSSMGYVAGDHQNVPEVQEAIARVLRACQAAGKYAGMFCTTAEQVQARFEQGFDFMNLGGDILAIGAWNSAELSKLSSIR